MLRSIVGLPYGDRYFFDYVLIGLFKLLGINSLNGIFVLFPLYIAFWSLCFLFLAYKTIGLVTGNRTAQGFAIVTVPFMVTYSLLSVGFLTETPALVMCTLGLYALLRYRFVRNDWYLPVISSVAFVAAAFTREPYLLFPLVALFFWAFLTLRRQLKPVILLIILIPTGLLFVQPFSPLSPFLQGGAPLVLPPPSSVNSTTILSTITVTSLTTSTIQSSSTSSRNSTSVSTTSSSSAAPPPPSPPSGVGLGSTIGHTISLFTLGMFLGWNPVLFLIGLVALLVFVLELRRDRGKAPVLLMALAAFGCSLVVALQYSASYHFYTTQGISTLIRYSSPSILAYILLAPAFYEKLQKNRLKIVGILLVGFTLVSIGAFSSLAQTNLGLTYSAFSFGHEFGPLEARQYLNSNASALHPSLAYISWDWKAGQLYLLNIPGLTVYPTFSDLNVNQTQFINYHPESFFILAAAPLASDVNDSFATLGLTAPPSFLQQTFDVFYNQTSSIQQTTYHITTIKTIFNSPTGYLLKVYVSWSQPQQ